MRRHLINGEERSSKTTTTTTTTTAITTTTTTTSTSAVASITNSQIGKLLTSQHHFTNGDIVIGTNTVVVQKVHKCLLQKEIKELLLDNVAHSTGVFGSSTFSFFFFFGF